jgi:hypothetical protein
VRRRRLVSGIECALYSNVFSIVLVAGTRVSMCVHVCVFAFSDGLGADWCVCVCVCVRACTWCTCDDACREACVCVCVCVCICNCVHVCVYAFSWGGRPTCVCLCVCVCVRACGCVGVGSGCRDRTSSTYASLHAPDPPGDKRRRERGRVHF